MAASDASVKVSNGSGGSVDFDALKKENGDIYAWIEVPGTDVSLPVVQNKYYDNFYLTHDVNGEESVAGAIYTQSMNALDFRDPVTVIYGHTFELSQEDLKDEAFGTLHNFEDPAFFDAHDTFYIYTPYKVLTYKVVSAYEYDDRHIMNSFDFRDEAVLQKYFDSVVNPESLVKNVREGVELKAPDSKIVVLSTCTRPANDSARYLVTGVLVDEKVLKQ